MSTRRVRVSVAGKVYDVSVELLDGSPSAPRPAAQSVAPTAVQAPEPTAPAAPTQAATGEGDVLSPLAGKVAAISATVGTQVNEGDPLITIEAMKMNTYVFAPKSGVVQAVLVSVGDGVEENKLLARIS